VTAHDEFLTAILDAAELTSPLLTPGDLTRVWRLLGMPDGDPALDDFLASVAESCDAAWDEGHGAGEDELGFRLGHWRIDVRKAATKSALLSAITAAALAHHGIAEIGITVATAVVPAVLEIERVTIRPGDRRLLLELRLKEEVRNRFRTEDQLYETLPPETRSVVNRYDFADLVQRLRDAGLTDKAGDGTIRLRAPKDP
jgi:hypothetical protein